MLSKKKKIITAALAGAICGYLLVTYGGESFLTLKAHAQFPQDIDGLPLVILEFFALIGSMIKWFGYYAIHLLEILIDPNNFVTIFEDNDYIKSLGGNPLNELWQISRDIVNVILAFILIAGAVFVIILPHKKEAVTGLVPKFVLAVILVNFSWWFPRVILDTASVLTSTIYTIPGAVSGVTGVTCEKENEDGSYGPCKIWRNPIFNPSNPEELEADGYVCDNNVCYILEDLAYDANTGSAIVLGLLFNYGRLLDLSRPPDLPAAPDPSGVDPNQAQGTDSAEEIFNLLLFGAFHLFLIIALLLPIIAMCVAFLIRIPVLWFTIAFMPFMFVGFVLGDKMGEHNTMKLIWKNFLASAFLPVVVAIPMAAGFLLLNTGQQLFNSGVDVPYPGHARPQVLGIVVHNFLGFLWICMTMAVLWIGTFTALKIQKISEGIVQSIQNWGQSVGKFAGSLPLRTPIIPLPGGSVTPLSMMNMPQRMRNVGANATWQQALSQALGGGGAGAAAGDITPAAQNVEKNIKQAITVDNNIQTNIQTNIKEIRKQADNNDVLVDKLQRGVDDAQTKAFDDQMKILKSTVRTHGKEELTLANIQAAARAAEITFTPTKELSDSINEWIRNNP